ncbi:MAG: hypothetical protein ACEQSN_10890 [Yersinia sp. (in: enterobacteria)]
MLNSPLISIKATELTPCPFCAGPPVTFIKDVIARKALFILGEWPEAGILVSADVFCHECGAKSEAAEGIVHLDSCLADLINKARANWINRDKRHYSLYLASQIVNESDHLDAFFEGKTE